MEGGVRGREAGDGDPPSTPTHIFKSKLVALVMHQSFVTTAPHTYGDRRVRGSDLSSFPAVQGKCRNIPPVEFSIIKSMAMAFSRSPQRRAFSTR